MTGRPATVRVAGAQGFWGDWLEAPYRQVTGGPVDPWTWQLAEMFKRANFIRLKPSFNAFHME